jgi:hypothetical protein
MGRRDGNRLGDVHYRIALARMKDVSSLRRGAAGRQIVREAHDGAGGQARLQLKYSLMKPIRDG